MSSKKPEKEKERLHPRNKNREKYDLNALTTAIPVLKNHIKPSKSGAASIDFTSPVAVRLLNQAILHHYYGIRHWEFPMENLCPPIPGRADYLHHIADILAEDNLGKIPTGNKITCLDIGIGASCIYPIIGVSSYGWQFIGSDIDPKSIASARNIVQKNSSLKGKIECHLQKDPISIFKGIINPEDKIDLTISNPPFHASIEEAQKGTRRKIKNLSGKKVKTPTLNFSGISHELIVDGGEAKFIQKMISESKVFSKNCFWFSTLVSKASNLKKIYTSLDEIGASQVKTVPLGTNNKSSRIVAWTFLTADEKDAWVKKRW